MKFLKSYNSYNRKLKTCSLRKILKLIDYRLMKMRFKNKDKIATHFEKLMENLSDRKNFVLRAE